MSAALLRRDHLAFALRLHRLLTGAAPDGDVVWSPHSVACALGLLAAGARSTTRAELTELLGAAPDDLLGALDRAAADSPDLASRTVLWVRPDVPVRSSFEAVLRDRPDSDVRTADFAGDPEGVRAAVNADVAAATRGMVRDLLTPENVTPDLLSVLVNALWVRARWVVPFEVHDTRDRTFHAPGGARRTALMHRTGDMPHAEAHGWRMVTLHAHDDVDVDVLLPPAASPAAEPPDAALLAALHRDAASTRVELALPRFDLTHRQELTPALVSSGVRTLFTDAADLSGVSPVPLRVDTVVHQARLRVDERGAEGAAATAVMMVLASAVSAPQPVRFVVDRPFHVAVRRRGTLLFLGSVTDPQDPGPTR